MTYCEAIKEIESITVNKVCKQIQIKRSREKALKLQSIGFYRAEDDCIEESVLERETPEKLNPNQNKNTNVTHSEGR